MVNFVGQQLLESNKREAKNMNLSLSGRVCKDNMVPLLYFNLCPSMSLPDGIVKEHNGGGV